MPYLHSLLFMANAPNNPHSIPWRFVFPSRVGEDNILQAYRSMKPKYDKKWILIQEKIIPDLI
jgi:hypothetical protein